jgi:hypothetical protein
MRWHSPDDGVPFGFRANRTNLQQMVSRIRTFTEQVDNSAPRIHGELLKLGFDVSQATVFSLHA